MAEEAKETTTQVTEAKAEAKAETTPAKSEGSFKPPVDASDMLLDSDEHDRKTGDFPPLFGEEKVYTQAELEGAEEAQDVKADEAKKEPPESQQKPPGEQKAEPQPKEGEKVEGKPDEKAEEKKASEEKPPPGHVPYAALHEERMKRKELADQVVALAQEMERLKAGIKTEEAEEGEDEEPTPKQLEDFKVLSDKELEEMELDDPEKAVKYLKGLRQYEKHKLAIERKENQKREEAAREQIVVKQSFARLAKTVPELFTENSTKVKELSDFAVSEGFDENTLYVLTDPATKIFNPKVSRKRAILGEGAAAIVEMIHKLKVASSKSEADLRASIEKELRPKITEEIMAKFKKPTEGEHRSIGDLPGSGDGTIKGTQKMLSEAEFARLSEAEKLAYLDI